MCTAFWLSLFIYYYHQHFVVISLTSSTGILKRRTCTHHTIHKTRSFSVSRRMKLQWEKNVEKRQHKTKWTLNTNKGKKITAKDDTTVYDECNIKRHTQNINRRKRKTEWNSELVIKRKQHEKRCFQFHMYRRKKSASEKKKEWL